MVHGGLHKSKNLSTSLTSVNVERTDELKLTNFANTLQFHNVAASAECLFSVRCGVCLRDLRR
jgi:hypothetical protein